MKRFVSPASRVFGCCCSSSIFSNDVWNDGNDGFAWKNRLLDERRSVALDYMANVHRRVPIHDSVRLRVKQNRERLLKEQTNVQADSIHSIEPDDETGEMFRVSGPSRQESPPQVHDDELERHLDSILDESTVDTLASLTTEELVLLRNEFYEFDSDHDRSTDDRLRNVLRDWYKLRKESSQYDSYCAVPIEERKAWSPWYLRDVKRREGQDTK